jgi:hypothetical protein
MRMVINITTCMQKPENGLSFGFGRRRCKHLEKGAFGGYICKRGNQIDFMTPKISKDNRICKHKEISRSA